MIHKRDKKYLNSEYKWCCVMGFHQQSKSMYVILIGDSKLCTVMSASVCLYMCVYVYIRCPVVD